MAICVKLQTFESVLDVTSTTHEDIIVVRIQMSKFAVRVILGYAPQETEPVELREHFFTELEIEVQNCKFADEVPLVMGDMNAKIESGEGEITALTSNGKLLLELIKNQEIDVLNFHESCVGKWTHVIRTTGSSSVLDYILSDKVISNAAEEILIDEECLFCPFSITKRKNKQHQQFSDHNAIILNLEIPHEKKKQNYVPKSWRLTKDGLEKFKQLTSCGFDDVHQGNVQEKYHHLERKIQDVMNKCFRVKRKNNQHPIQKVCLPMYIKLTKFARGGKAQRRVAKQYIEQILKTSKEKVADVQKKKIQTTLDNLSINNTFSPNRFWDLCKKSRKSNDIGTSIETDDGREIFGKEMICNTYMSEFKHRLRKREIDDDLRNYEAQTELLCEMYLEGSIEKGPPYSKEELDKVKKRLKRGKSSGRDNLPAEIFIEGGEQLEKSILSLFNLIKADNGMPHQWTEVQISTLYKNKGKRKRIINRRGIFLKQVMSKMYGTLNMNRAKQCMKSINKCQAGGTENRSPADQTFLLRAAVDHAKYLDKPLFLTLYDYSQCFDSLWLSDCLLSLIKIGVEKEIVSILKKMNETCNIVVKTPTGDITEEFQMSSIVQQGSVSGGALCVASLAEIFEEDLGKGFQIGAAILRALAFVDDIATLNKNHIDVYTSHKCVEWFSAKKRLSLNALKCLLLCINVKPNDVIPRLKIGDIALEIVERAPYLGDMFNAAGTNKDLIEDRVKKGKACIVNAMSLCSEITMGIYTIDTLFLLYNYIFLAIVLYNAQSWSNLTASNLQNLQVIQLRYLKRMLHAPSSTSNPLTFLETGTIPIEKEIHTRQLNFLHHILTLEDGDPVKTAYSEQLKYAFEPNWGNATLKLRIKYGICETDEEISQISKENWKKTVKSKVKSCAFKELIDQARLQKHSHNITLPSELCKQEYLSKLPSANARKVFHIRTGTIDLKGNRKYMYGDDTSCRLCHGNFEDVEHVVNKCPSIPREKQMNIKSTDCEELLEVSNRCILFDSLINDKEKQFEDDVKLDAC